MFGLLNTSDFPLETMRAFAWEIKQQISSKMAEIKTTLFILTRFLSILFDVLHFAEMLGYIMSDESLLPNGFLLFFRILLAIVVMVIS